MSPPSVWKFNKLGPKKQSLGVELQVLLAKKGKRGLAIVGGRGNIVDDCGMSCPL